MSHCGEAGGCKGRPSWSGANKAFEEVGKSAQKCKHAVLCVLYLRETLHLIDWFMVLETFVVQTLMYEFSVE